LRPYTLVHKNYFSSVINRKAVTVGRLSAVNVDCKTPENIA
jgi:hypothetical protein